MAFVYRVVRISHLCLFDIDLSSKVVLSYQTPKGKHCAKYEQHPWIQGETLTLWVKRDQ